MRTPIDTLSLLPSWGVRLDALGALPVWADPLDFLHSDRSCLRPVTERLVTAAEFLASAKLGRLCARCNTASEAPWWPAVAAAWRLHEAVVGDLLRPRTSTGGWPDHALSRWVQVAHLASKLAHGEAALRRPLDGLPEIPGGVRAELVRWLQEAVDHGRSELSVRRAQLGEQYDLNRVCWRYVDLPLPAGRLSTSAAKLLRSAWRAALRHGRTPVMAAWDARNATRLHNHPAAEEALTSWTAEGQRAIDDSLAAPWHEVAIVEPGLAAAALYRQSTGKPQRSAERRNFAIAYFDGRHLVEHDVLILTVPSVIAASLGGKALSADLGVSPAFPTPEHLRAAFALRSTGGAMADLGRAAHAARLVLDTAAA